MGFERHVGFLSGGRKNLHKGFERARLHSILHFDQEQRPLYSIRYVLPEMKAENGIARGRP